MEAFDKPSWRRRDLAGGLVKRLQHKEVSWIDMEPRERPEGWGCYLIKGLLLNEGVGMEPREKPRESTLNRGEGWSCCLIDSVNRRSLCGIMGVLAVGG